MKIEVDSRMQNAQKSPWFLHPTLLSVGLLYGASYSIAKFALNANIPPFGFVLLRVFFGAIILSVIQWFFVREKVVSRKDLISLAKCGLFGVALNQLFFLKGLSFTTAVNSSLIMTLIPVMVMVFSYFILKETVGPRKLLGLGLALTGAILLLYKEEFGISKDTLKGDLLNLVNASSYALYLVIVKPLMQKYHPLTVVKWVFIFSFFFVFPFGITDVVGIQWSEVSMPVWGSIVYVILAVTVLVYWLNVITLKYTTPSIVGVYIYLQPLFASLVAVLFFDETFGVKQMIAALFVFAGVYFVSFSKQSKKQSA